MVSTIINNYIYFNTYFPTIHNYSYAIYSLLTNIYKKE